MNAQRECTTMHDLTEKLEEELRTKEAQLNVKDSPTYSSNSIPRALCSCLGNSFDMTLPRPLHYGRFTIGSPAFSVSSDTSVWLTPDWT